LRERIRVYRFPRLHRETADAGGYVDRKGLRSARLVGLRRRTRSLIAEPRSSGASFIGTPSRPLTDHRAVSDLTSAPF
jgi:hypothetical protein